MYLTTVFENTYVFRCVCVIISYYNVNARNYYRKVLSFSELEVNRDRGKCLEGGPVFGRHKGLDN